MNFVDNFLDRITMYRLILYFLIVLIAISVAYSFLGIIHFSPFVIILSTFLLILVSLVSNKIFAAIFKAPTNVESAYISALILSLIITPTQTLSGIIFLVTAALLATSSKYILAINKKHIFNPSAIAVVITSLLIGQSPSWWIGDVRMLPFVIIGGLLIVKKIQKEDLVLSFLITIVVAILGSIYFKHNDLIGSLSTIFFHSPLFFFAFIMLTEPSTTPPAKNMRIICGVLVAILFAYSTPEMGLIIGNVFSYLVSSKDKLILTLKNKKQIGADILDFTFNLNKKFNFAPGQYLEWTLPHKGIDSRGNRRYFTIASSPTENNLRLGIKFYPQGSSFKRTLANLDAKTPLVASQLAGDFVLPKDMNKKLVFIAGGIGITPFRSMIKYLLDTNQERQIILLYSNKTASEIVYADILKLAFSKLGIKTVYTLTGESPVDWKGRVGRIDAKMIAEEVPDWKSRLFYLSGPHGMVAGFEQVLKNMGVGSNQIKIDFFPGYA